MDHIPIWALFFALTSLVLIRARNYEPAELLEAMDIADQLVKREMTADDLNELLYQYYPEVWKRDFNRFQLAAFRKRKGKPAYRYYFGK